MKIWYVSLLTLAVAASAAVAQSPMPSQQSRAVSPDHAAIPAVAAQAAEAPAILDCLECESGGRGFITGNQNFPNFIGYVSNPLFAIDPRAVSILYPIFGSNWIETNPRLPNGNFQLYGAGLNLALTERLAVGLNQGGYAHADFERNTLIGERGRDREGWLNLGGFVQYTVFQDVPSQCLATLGMRWTAPSGSSDIFQGRGPARLATYATLGKEFGEFHVLTTAGYDFPAGSSGVDINFFYGTVHLDRRCFGWLYPLVEFNWAAHTETVDINAFREGGFIDFGNFTASGNTLILAAGVNAVLIPNRLEFGAVYTTPIATQHDFDFNGLLVKIVYRF